jgi:hypothetical protein
MKLGSIAAYALKGGQSHYVTERPSAAKKSTSNQAPKAASQAGRSKSGKASNTKK